MKYMISANLINNLKDSKRRNRDIVKIYKKEIKKNDISQKEKKYMQSMCILLESENKDIDSMLKRYNNVANRKKKKLLGVL